MSTNTVKTHGSRVWKDECLDDHAPKPAVTHIAEYDAPDDVVVIYNEQDIDGQWITADPDWVYEIGGRTP